MTLSPRSLLRGLGAALITAPAIVRADSLMPVRSVIEPVTHGFDLAAGPDMSAMWVVTSVEVSGGSQPTMIVAMRRREHLIVRAYNWPPSFDYEPGQMVAIDGY